MADYSDWQYSDPAKERQRINDMVERLVGLFSVWGIRVFIEGHHAAVPFWVAVVSEAGAVQIRSGKIHTGAELSNLIGQLERIDLGLGRIERRAELSDHVLVEIARVLP